MRIRLEHFLEEPASPSAFWRRVARFAGLGLGLIASTLLVGVLGYHFLEDLPWIDALLNAAMILGGMGPVGDLHTYAGKVFASAYALLSGLMILASAGVVATPIVHRLLHHWHADVPDEPDGPAAKG
jgi:hypothetical protein